MRIWIRISIAILLIAALACAGYSILRCVGAAARNIDLAAGEPDPMFAEPAETVTRPPELDEEEPQPEHPTLDDYVPAEESPVDKTVDELIAEAKNAN